MLINDISRMFQGRELTKKEANQLKLLIDTRTRLECEPETIEDVLNQIREDVQWIKGRLQRANL